MTTDPEQSIPPPIRTGEGNAPDAETPAPDPELDTKSGVDSSAGDDADATTSDGADLPDGERMPSIRDKPSVGDIKKADAAMDPTQAVRDYSDTKAV